MLKNTIQIVRMGYDIYKYFVFALRVMSEDVFEEDKAVNKILKDETLDEKSYLHMM